MACSQNVRSRIISPMKKDKDTGVTPPRWALIAKSLMAEQGIIQEDLKDVFDVGSRGAVGHYLKGRRQPSIEHIVRLAKRLGVTTSELVGEIPLADSRYKQEILQLSQEVGAENMPLVMAVIRAAVAGIRKENGEETQ